MIGVCRFHLGGLILGWCAGPEDSASQLKPSFSTGSSVPSALQHNSRRNCNTQLTLHLLVIFNDFLVPSENLLGKASLPCTHIHLAYLNVQMARIQERPERSSQALIVLMEMFPKASRKWILGFLTLLLFVLCCASFEWEGEKKEWPTLSNLFLSIFKKCLAAFMLKCILF